MNEFISKSLLPISDGYMFCESVMPILFEGKKEIRCPLRFTPQAIESVKSFSLDVEYEPGTDYTLQGNELILHPQNKPFLYMEERQLLGKNLPPEAEKDHLIYNFPILYTDTPFIIERQLAVTYRYDAEEWVLPPSVRAATALSRTRQKLKNGKLRILLFGDSISNGADSSGQLKVPPYLPSWYELIRQKLQYDYGAEVELINISVSGQNATWAIDHLDACMKDICADLMIIAFGMNDASMQLDLEAFVDNIRKIRINQKQPDCEFILIGTMFPNPASGLYHDHRKYAEALYQLEDERTAVVDVGAIQEFLLQGKRYADMTGNNINHPNDFLARMYATEVLSVIG